MDVLMLREVLASQAFLQKNGLGRKNAADNLLQLPVFPPMLTARRECTNLLVCQFKKDRLTNEKSSGIEEVTEKSILLEELLSLEEEGERKAMEGLSRTDPSPSTSNDIDTGDSSSSFRSTPSPDGLNKKRKPEENMYAFLEEKEKQRRREKEEELALRRMELELQREQQEEGMKARREAEEFVREKRRAFLQMMHMFMGKNSK
ncbi:hypothetical protein PoB_001494000 [Plakobranchus ocellatus]|uniref:Uncharacterized protein n=1 Tax=Plakobranchus ocellatus TaxID=259542 RepID=A0AAV3Z1A8_9GAST|nr:hypothetical protein PoB_001494000 [Plakobranchus ocellatus]